MSIKRGKKLLRIKSQLVSLSGNESVIGMQKEASQLSKVKLASAEFGVPSRNVPKRPVIRKTFRSTKNRSQYKKILASSVNDLFKEKTTAKGIYDNIGKKIKFDMKTTIINTKSPPNAPSTIEQKGFNDPLEHTQQMLRDIDNKTRPKSS